MKRLLIFAALVLGLASCQREPEGLDVNVGGEVETFVTVNLPEDVTRAVAGTDSAQSDINAILLKGDLKLRYILQVFNAEGDSFKAMDFKYADAKSVVFPVRLVPNRHYRFVVWADLVENNGLVDGQDCDDLHYVIGTSLRDIKLADEWKAMDETRDAYTGYYKTTGNGFVGTESINITLTRPFAKLRVVTTDIDELFDGVYPHNAVVTYTTNHYKAFDAFAATPGDRTLAGKEHIYVIDTYSGENPAEQMTLYTDYFFATEEDDAVRFNINVKEANGTTIKLSSFNTDIKVKRNYLTTLIGDVLTEGNNVNVNVQPGLGGQENPNIVYNVITSGAELEQAVDNGGSYMLGNDIYVSSPVASTLALTRADEGKTTTINLNGFDITVKNTGTDPFITVGADDTLVFSGDGEVTLTDDSTAAFINNEGDVVLQGGTHSSDNNNVDIITGNGDIYKTGGDIDQDNVKSQLEALQYVCANGGEMTLTTDITVTKQLAIENNVTIDGNGKTIIYTGSDLRLFDVQSGNHNFTLKNVNIKFETGYCQRGINYNTGGTLTIENVNIVEGTTYPTYTINLPSKANGAKVEIKDSNIKGHIALNIWAQNVVANATDSTFSNYDTTDVEDYVTVKLNNNGTDSAEHSIINIYGGTVIAKDQNGDACVAISNNTITGQINVSDTTEVTGTTKNTVAAVRYNGYNEFYGCYTLASAIERATNDSNATIVLVRDIEVSETQWIEGNVTLDLNNKTVSCTADRFFRILNEGTEVINVTIKNGKLLNTANGGRCVETRSGNIALTLEDVELEATNGTWPQPLTIGGSGENITVNINESSIKANYVGYGITTFNPVALNVTNTTIDAWAALNLREPLSSVGSNGSEINVTGSTFICKNITNGESNAFAAIKVADDGIDLNIDSTSTITVEALGDQPQGIIDLSCSNNPTIDNCNVTIAAEINANGNPLILPENSIGNNTVIKFAAKYADTLKNENWTVSEAEDGFVTVTVK